jgi:hypothetical protein
MTDHVIHVETANINLSPVMFRLNSHDYFKAYLDFEKPGSFSPVPFFLCCRAIELALKALHLESKTRKEVKDLYSHNLIKSYDGLDECQRILSTEERGLLVAASEIYVKKEFEYLNVYDAGTAYTRFPDLTRLEDLTRIITGYDA